MDAACGPDAAAPACAVELHVLQRASHWRERDADGTVLVRESGALRGLGLTLMQVGAGGGWHAGFERLSGTRDYDGRTSTGQPAHSRSDIVETGLALGVDRTVAGGWTLGLDGRWRWVDRNLQGIASALGYAERWTWLDLGLRAQGRHPVGAGWLVADLGLSLSPWARVDLQLPGRDPASLRPARGRAVALGVGWSRPISAGGDFTAAWQARTQAFAASAIVAVTSNGALRGTARQPATRIADQTLSIGWRLAW